MRYEKVCIEALRYELPRQSLETRAIEGALSPLYTRMGIRPGWLEAVTGVKARRVWGHGEDPEAAAARAAQEALDHAGIARSQVDVLVSTSVYKAELEPSVACAVHDHLGLRDSCLNFDVGNACLGFMSGMGVVANMIELGQARVGIVVAGESSREVTESTLARLGAPSADMTTYKDNLATLTLGSAAVAMVLVHRDLSTNQHRFNGGVQRSASRHRTLCHGGLDGMTTDPARLLSEGVKLAKRTFEDFRGERGRGARPIAGYALHQVGRANHESVLKALQLPADRALAIYPEFGNVGAAAVPLALARTLELGRAGQGDTVAMMGIGSGLNVAMMSVDW
ncbi:MAG: 3-oxoacyl-ACP synthase III [Myxococcota bacterium]|nr:3-oxoacyl-ACP synthase III [Myxococcota bacterium]